MLSRPVLFVFILGFHQAAIASNGCPPKILQALKALEPRLKSAQLARKNSNKLASLQKVKQETLKPIFEHVQNAYKKGQEISKLKYEMMDLKRVPNPDKVQLDRMAEIEVQYAAITREITDINNKYITELHTIYSGEGIPALIVTRDDGVKILKLDFSAPPTKKTAYEFYRRVQSRFGLKEVTLSLKQNAEAGFGGFFSPAEQRIDMGPGQGLSMLEDYFNSVSKHESRHSMFFHKRAVGDDSIFHTQFFASSKGDLLNADKVYDTYMSSEEVYTFSTDLQSLAQAFSRDVITDAAAKQQLVNQISSHNETFLAVTKSTKGVTQEMVNSLDELKKSINPSEAFQVFKSETDQLSIEFGDKLNRRTSIIMVSEAEKKLAQKMLDAVSARSSYLDQYVTNELVKKGTDIKDFMSRLQQGQVTADEVSSIQKLALEGMNTTQGKILTKELNQTTIPLIQNARENMAALNKLSEIQIGESEKIDKMLKKIIAMKDKVTDEEIAILKHQLFNTAKNVKEDYRGFALNPKKIP